MKLYLVTSEEYSDRPTIDIVKEAVDSGIDMVQMREKSKSPAELLELGKKLKKLCKISCVKFIVNDDPHLAKKINADGVHLGQEDMKTYPIKDIRKLLRDKLIGLSTHSVEQVKQANDLELDYIAYGPVFSTQTKDYSVGTKEIKEVIRLSRYPVFFIGGINLDNVGFLQELGVQNIAVISTITRSKDIAKTIHRFKGDNMQIKINGKQSSISSRTIKEAVDELNLDSKNIVIEYNKKITERSDWQNIRLKEDDNLEIISFVGGG